MEKFLVLAYRALFALSGLVALLAIAEGVAQLLGRSLVRGDYSAGRLLELAALLAVFVIALLLREIRALLKAKPA